MSNRAVPKITKVDHKTVAPVRDDLERRGEIPHVETRTDTKGRQQPANKPERKTGRLKRFASDPEELPDGALSKSTMRRLAATQPKWE